MAALSVTYAFAFQSDLDLAGTGHADAAGLEGGGVAVVADHTDHIDEAFFSANGGASGAGTFAGNTGGSVSQLSNGNVVIAGSLNGLDGGEASFTIVSATGATIVEPTPSDSASNQILGVDVAGLAGGGFVLAMQASNGGNNNVQLTIRDNDGGLVIRFTVDGTIADDQAPSVAALADGGFAVAWHRVNGAASEMWYAVFEANGMERKLPTLLDDVGSNLNASVVALQDGGFAIGYEDTGWSDTGDVDITLARFDADGVLAGSVDLSQNDSNDTTPSTTLLSNGMIVVGSSSAEAGFDPTWTLVDPETGARLGFGSTGLTAVSDTHTSVAGMSDGQVAAFFTNGPMDPHIIGQVLQVQRHTDGGAGNHAITGDELVDFIDGAAGDDTIRGAGGDDVLTGGGGIDTLRGGLGDDTYMVNSAGEAREAAGEGMDTVNSRVSYTLGVNIENLVLLGTGDLDGTGNSLKNKLTGNNGANALDGGLDVDVLQGGRGADTLTGGDARDRFDFTATMDSAPGTVDVITDFAGNGALAGDLINLSPIDANALVGGNQAFVFIGTAAFTGAGQVRYVHGLLLASTDGDVQAELRIELTGNPPLVAADLLL